MTMEQARVSARDPERAPGKDEAGDRLLPWRRVQDQTGVSRTTAWRMERNGDFPERVQVSPGRVGWRESEVTAWNQSRHKARMPPVAGGKGRPRKDSPSRAGPPSVRPDVPERLVSEPTACPAARSSPPVPEAPCQCEPVSPTSSAMSASRHRRPRLAPGQLGFDF